MKMFLMLSVLVSGLNAFAQSSGYEMNCSSADQKVSIQLSVNPQGKFKSLVINNSGKLTAVSRDQLNTFSGEAIVFETDTTDLGVLNMKNTYVSLGSGSANITVGVYGLAPNAYQLDMTKATQLICKYEAK